MKIKKQTGGALLEGLICLAIMAVMLVIGLAWWQDESDVLLADSKAHELQQLIHFARSTAILSGLPVTLCPLGKGFICGTDWSAGIMLYQQLSSFDRSSQPPLQVISGNPNRYELRFEGFTSHDRLHFDPTGTLHQNGCFHYCSKHSSHHWELIVSRAGRARLLSYVV